MSTSRLFLATLSSLLLAQGPGPSQLHEAVADYWGSMAAGDYAAALAHVHPDDRNLFIQRTHPPVRNWEIGEIELADRQARVRVGFEQQVEAGGRFYPFKAVQDWVLVDAVWQLRLVRITKETLARLHAPVASSEPELPVLVVAPTVVKFPFINPRSMGWFRISNGLQEPVGVLGLEFDAEKFKLVQAPPETIPPRSARRVRLEYLGSEEQKDLKSPLVVRLEQGGQERVYRLTLLYNHIDAATKTFFGLSDEEARNLKRGARLTPSVKLPEGVKPPPVKPPPER